MRIGLSSTTFEPQLASGKIDGIGMYTQNLYEAFLKGQQDVTPFFFPQRNRSEVTSGFAKGRSLHYSYSHSTLLSLACPSFYSIHGDLQRDIDIFHATDHMVPKLKNVPTVATINDALMFKHPEWHSVRFGHLKKLARKKTLEWADHFITISETMVPEIVEFAGVPQDKISVVYLGVAASWYEQVSEEAKELVREKYCLPQQFLLFTGTLQQKKNLPRLIEAYLQLPLDIQEAYPLVVVGRAGWGMDESLAAIDRLTAAGRGVWLKYVSYEELRALFQMASLYLHPSLHEGFGLTLLEAFASGTPVVTSNVAALPEIAGGAACLVDPYSVVDIRLGIERMLMDVGMRDGLARQGLVRAKEFSWEKCAEQTLKIYRELL